jgi:hypothetical protein
MNAADTDLARAPVTDTHDATHATDTLTDATATEARQGDDAAVAEAEVETDDTDDKLNLKTNIQKVIMISLLHLSLSSLSKIVINLTQVPIKK